MNKEILLSIIIPCYNSDRFIARTLDMLISQDLSECEVIVVNDGSKDNTKKIVSEYAQKTSNIHLINQENSGVSVARNTGIKNATGKYIYFLDSDDALTDGSLDFFREMLKEHSDCQWFGFGYKTISTNGSDSLTCYPNFNNQELDQIQLTKTILKKDIYVSICSSIYERKMLKENNIEFTPGIITAEDLEFMYKVYPFVQKGFYSSRVTFVYLRRDDSISLIYRTYSLTRFKGFNIVKNILNTDYYQSEVLKPYTTFQLQWSLVAHTKGYLKAKYKNQEITEAFVKQCAILKRKTIFSNNISYQWILLAKLLPLKMVLRILKSPKNNNDKGIK